MNTIRSTWIGWGTLMVAGGGAYYFAKKSVNADKKARHEEDMKRRRLKESLEAEFIAAPPSTRHHKKPSHVDGAAKHEDVSSEFATEAKEASKYLPAKPYKAKKGDRFS